MTQSIAILIFFKENYAVLFCYTFYSTHQIDCFVVFGWISRLEINRRKLTRARTQCNRSCECLATRKILVEHFHDTPVY